MKFEMELYNRICEITGVDYQAAKTDDENHVLLYHDLDNVIYDLVDKYDKLIEKINDKINYVQECKFQIDMIDHWDAGDRLAYVLRGQELNNLKDLLKESDKA